VKELGNQTITQGKNVLTGSDIDQPKSVRQVNLKARRIDKRRSIDVASIVKAMPGKELLNEVTSMPRYPACENHLATATSLHGTDRHPHKIPG